MRLVIGNKNYSSWSLRPWLLLSGFQVEFTEIQESLAEAGIKERFEQYSPSGKVPVLVDEDLIVWDSLAICEYISEKYRKRSTPVPKQGPSVPKCIPVLPP